MPTNQPTHHQPNYKNGRQQKPAVLPEQASVFAGIAGFPGVLVSTMRNGNLESPTVGLDQRALHPVQRQALAAHIAKAHGNLHLQKVIQRQTNTSAAKTGPITFPLGWLVSEPQPILKYDELLQASRFAVALLR